MPSWTTSPRSLITCNWRFMTPRSGRDVSRLSSTLTQAWIVSPALTGGEPERVEAEERDQVSS
jgi:hypothetical protein